MLAWLNPMLVSELAYAFLILPWAVLQYEYAYLFARVCLRFSNLVKLYLNGKLLIESTTGDYDAVLTCLDVPYLPQGLIPFTVEFSSPPNAVVSPFPHLCLPSLGRLSAGSQSINSYACHTLCKANLDHKKSMACTAWHMLPSYSTLRKSTGWAPAVVTRLFYVSFSFHKEAKHLLYLAISCVKASNSRIFQLSWASQFVILQ